MGGLRTLRNQSGSNGSRTLGSILANSSGLGPASFKRVYHWALQHDPELLKEYQNTMSYAYKVKMSFL